MSARYPLLLLALLLASCAASGPGPGSPRDTDLVAINVLLDPDATMLERAVAANESLRAGYPAGFALDSGHAPHLTVLQAFVARRDLDRVVAAVAGVVRRTQPTTGTLTATGHWQLPWQGLALAGIAVAPTPRLRRFQEQLIVALEPLMVRAGTGAAFVAEADGQVVSQLIVDYVNGFVPKSSGTHFNPHVTVGVGEGAFVAAMVAEPFTPFSFRAQSVSIYQLGEFGTARRKLWTSAPDALPHRNSRSLTLNRG